MTKKTDIINSNKKWLRIIFWSVILVGALLRINGLFSSFEYDEIWTIKSWLPLSWWRILTEFSAPNNHPLNSLFMKLFTLHSPGNIILLRLPNLICGIALMPLVYFLAKMLTKNRQIALLSMAMTAFHSGLIYYSHCARGYSMVTFWVILFTFFSYYCILKYDELNTKQRYLLVAALIISMVASCMTFCASILFIAPIMIIHCVFLIKKYWQSKGIIETIKVMVINNKELIFAWLIMTVFAFWLYIGHYHEFQKGTAIASGVTVNSFSSFIQFINQLFPQVLFWSILPLVFVPIFDKRYAKIFYWLCFIILFSFVSIIFAKGGPPRAYLPILPLMFISAACGISIISKALLHVLKYEDDNSIFTLSCICAALAIVPAMYANKWAPIDWFKSFESIKKISQDKMVIYRACETFPLAYNINGKVYIDNFSRISKIRSDQKIIFVDIPDQTINGSNQRGDEKAYKITEKGKAVRIGDLPSTVYILKKITPQSNIKNKTLLAVIPFILLQQKNAIMKYLFTMPNSKWLLLNCFLTVSETRRGQKYSSATMAYPNNHKLSVKQLLAIEYKSKGKLRFYIVEAYK